jgi:hypothetical protein
MKGVKAMEYTKPELVPFGAAITMIESSLAKTGAPPDSTLGQDYPTATSAYEADE